MATSKAITAVAAVPFGEPVRVVTSLLQLDSDNPRLVATDVTTNDAIIRELHEEGELSELLQSIAANGYLDFEPLVVTLFSGQSKLTVLEGNRRLAAIRVLTEPKLATRLSITAPEVPQKFQASLEAVRVIRVHGREEARPFIAFKHINGPHRWESYAKGKYAAEWYASGKRKGGDGISIGEIADKIGDNHDTIKRMVAAIYVLEQAERQKIFKLDDRATKKFHFSHLYTALSRSEYMGYLGLDEGWTKFDPKPDPIGKPYLAKLGEVLNWIFGSKSDDEPSIIRSQNPDIKDLGTVLTHAAALHVLREERSLSKALAQAVSPSEKLSSSLVRALTSLQEAVANLRAFDGKDDSLFELVEEISELVETLSLRMKEKLAKAKKGK